MLPNANEHVGEIFVVGPVGDSGNAYEEYIAIHSPSYGKEYIWELVGGGNVSIDLSEYYTKTQSDEKYQPKGNYLTEIPDEFITDEELTKRENSINERVDKLISEQEKNISLKQDTLVSGSNIKTINGIDVLGEGNIEIKVDTKDIDLTGYATEQWVESKGYLTKIPEEYITTAELEESTADWESNDGTSFIKNRTHYKTVLGETGTLILDNFDYDSVIADNIPAHTTHIYANVLELSSSKIISTKELDIVNITSNGPSINILLSRNEDGTLKIICKKSYTFNVHFYLMYYEIVPLDSIYLPDNIITTENVNHVTLDGGETTFN